MGSIRFDSMKLHIPNKRRCRYRFLFQRNIIYLFELFAGTVASSLFLDQKLVVCVYVFRSRCAM